MCARQVSGRADRTGRSRKKNQLGGGFRVVRWACGEVRAIGGILGVYGQALTEGEPPMTVSQSALSELLEAFRAGDGADLVRDSVRVVLQELIELEATERIGAAKYA